MDKEVLEQAVVSWYEFDRDEDVLVVGTKTAAAAAFFRAGFQNVTVHESCGGKELLPEESSARYDVIAAIDAFGHAEDPAAFLRACMHLLREGGHLLFTVENRYGLKYFCGSKDPYTGMPYDGVNGYLKGDPAGGRCFSRREVLSSLRESGISAWKFYYPVPDDRMPQMIFTDQYRKGINAAERLVDYDYEDPAMLGVEHRIFPEMIEDGALPFLANSFLVEAAKGSALSDIIYAVITADRGKEGSLATTIHADGTVRKRPLWQEGEANIRKLHGITGDLAARGIPVLPTELREDACGPYLSMPYVEEEGLTQVLERDAVSDREQFFAIFDRIYEAILSASEPAEGSDPENPVLVKLYPELAPCNCFYRKETDELLFYDQEFVLENAPAKFALYRGIKYLYASARGIGKAIPPEGLQQRYGINEKMAAEFEEMENRFLNRVRSRDEYQPLFQSAEPAYDRICKKMEEFLHLPACWEKKPYHIGYVPGVFDLFHTGHLNLLERCKERCDILIVGVLTDELAEYYKGKKPVIPYEDRARLIEALSIVDQVIPVDFSNTDKLDAWEQLHYDCHFSGDDHAEHWNDVLKELRKRGSNMEFFPYTQGISTTMIRETIQNDLERRT